MKAIPSGVILSAAMMRSPSFSRSASSTTTTNSPRAMAATASSIGANGIVNPLSSRSHQALDVLGHQVDLQVHRGARTLDPESGHGSRVGDQGELEGRVVDPGHGETDTVDGDRALLHHIAEDGVPRRHDHPGGTVGQVDPFGDLADAVDVTLDDVAAEPVGEADGPLEVHGVPAVRAPRQVRRSVSSTASAAHQPSPSSTAVRQQPLTAMEAPRTASSRTVVASISRRAPVALAMTARTVPSSSTRPVNTRNQSPSGEAGEPPKCASGEAGEPPESASGE